MKYKILAAGLLAAISTGYATAYSGQSDQIALTAAVVVLCAIWWIFEPVPIPVTSMIPLAVLPLGGVLTAEQIGACVGDKLVLLMMGGFMLSMAM
ncbi:MAG: anion permease, partial [Rubripirellula sp.]|nr:anion permease [Rubripirellula sp.]